MEQEAQPSVEQEVAASEPTLDDVISEFNISNTVETPQPVENTEQQPMTIDSYDSDSIQKYVDNGLSQQQQTMEQLQSQIDAMHQKESAAQMNADIKQAVGVLTSSVDGLNPDLAEAFLEMKARKDANFNTIWNNRQSNPNALSKAMEILSTEAKNTFSLKQDGQLVENQRAMQQSIQSNTNQASPVNSLEQQLNSADTMEERDRIRRTMMAS